MQQLAFSMPGPIELVLLLAILLVPAAIILVIIRASRRNPPPPSAFPVIEPKERGDDVS